MGTMDLLYIKGISNLTFFTENLGNDGFIETQVLLLERLDSAVQRRYVCAGTAVYSESVAACAVIQVVSSRSKLTAYTASKKITLGIIGPCLGTGLGADGKTRACSHSRKVSPT